MNDEIKIDTLKSNYKLYIEERKILVESLQKGSQSFDKAILTLASGSFGLTIIFLRDIVPIPYENTKWLLHYSWSLFALTILLILISFLTSQKACLRQIDNAYEVLVNHSTNIKNYWAIITMILNYTSIVLLIISYICWGLFVFQNL